MNLTTRVSFSQPQSIQNTGLRPTRLLYTQIPDISLNKEVYHSPDNCIPLELQKNNLSIIEKERVKIGHELHDNVNSLLAIAKLYMDIIKTVTPKENLARSRAISSIMMAITNIREISSGLVISQKKEINLTEMIGDLVERINTTEIFKISFTAQHKIELNELSHEQKQNVFRIIQEQLNNTIKYSRAKLVNVIIAYKKGIVKLAISDDGVGFDTSKSNKGIGLNNINKRVNDLNGFLEIKSSPGNGCLLHIAFPVTPRV